MSVAQVTSISQKTRSRPGPGEDQQGEGRECRYRAKPQPRLGRRLASAAIRASHATAANPFQASGGRSRPASIIADDRRSHRPGRDIARAPKQGRDEQAQGQHRSTRRLSRCMSPHSRIMTAAAGGDEQPEQPAADIDGDAGDRDHHHARGEAGRGDPIGARRASRSSAAEPALADGIIVQARRAGRRRRNRARACRRTAIRNRPPARAGSWKGAARPRCG